MRTIELLTAPTTELLSTADVHEWTGDGATILDPLFTKLIKRCRNQLEQELRLALLDQTWKLTLDYSDIVNGIPIPRPPLQSITSVKTIAGTTGTPTTVSSSNYRVVLAAPPLMGRVILLDGQVWGEDVAEEAGMEIEFLAGYGSAIADLDDKEPRLFTALSELVEFYRVHRGAGVMGDGKGPERSDTPQEIRRIFSIVRDFEVVRGE